MGWVLDHSPAEGAERLVLLSLANHAGPSPVDGAWESYPGVETIQKEANLRRVRTVQEVLARLIAGGHIQRIVNGAPDERIRSNRRPNLYRILVSAGRGFVAADDKDPVKESDDEPAPRGAAGRHGTNGSEAAVSGAAARHPSDDLGVPSHDNQGCRLTTSRGAVSQRPGVPPDGTQTVSEPSVEPSVEPKTVIAVPATARPLTLVADDVAQPPVEAGGLPPQTTWELFWQRWPRKTHKAEARDAWRKLIGAGVSDTEILAGLDRWLAYWQADATEERHIRYPARWLTTRAWAETPPALARSAGTAPGADRKTDRLRSVLTDFVAQETSA